MVRRKRVTGLMGAAARRTSEIAAVIGIVVMAGAAALVPASFVPLIGWDAAALSFLTATWWRIGRLDGPATAADVAREDPSRAGADLAVLVAAVASLVAVAYLVVQADTPAELVLHVGVGVASVVVSWAVVHTIFTLRYTRMFYTPDPWGGVDFHDHDPDAQPRFTDFAYLAFTVGMTFQVSDTELNTPAFRAAVLRQALLSYLFGAVILALTINLVAGVGR
ncbi:hypothetical protein Nocox_17160 [Nonomuraea coxensis DSM 45129]|uniref:DUF1345 domain-containing protein n=1 Tax=Nonomuraea coxensis DSM 45129 TaxID=1122611 RepID=A0ABX8U075_9ACTN|nr:DUF1345 domain-containing protein [Nonomuraea coxensis]QYC41044.1 hypothetical protein Nocox_17160 [Nonomuraea coxensis DSM 45129]